MKCFRPISLVVLICCCVLSTVNVQAANYTLTVDAKTSWGQLPHFWSQCHAVGRLGLLGRDTLRNHIKDAVKNLGVKMIRSHAGVSDAQIYSEVNGVPTYSWKVCDSLYDFLVDTLKVKPFVEVDWIPKDLQTTTCSDSARYCPPKDYTKWKNLIYEFVKHLKERYGAAEIETWRFETWNEAEWFGMYSQTGGLPMTDNWKTQWYSTQGALMADSNIVIGGPATSGFSWEKSQSGPYLNYAGTNGYRVDFLSYHAYHEFPNTVEGHFMALDTMAFYNKKYPKLHCIESSNTEFGPTYQFKMDPQPQETDSGSVFVADMMSQIARRCHAQNKQFPFMYAWWVISDVFDESTYRIDYPFIGCMGYLSRQNIKKPVYNAYKMMNMLGNNFIAINSNSGTIAVNGLAASDTATKGVQVLVYNPDYSSNKGTDNVTVTVNNINSVNGKVNYRSYLVDRTHSNSYQKWLDMGKPKNANMSTANWDTLKKSMELETIDSTDNMTVTNNAFTKQYTLTKRGVMLISLTPPQETGVIPQLQPVDNLEHFKVDIQQFNKGISVSMKLSTATMVKIALFDCSGKIVKNLAPVSASAGLYNVTLGKENFKSRSGVYFVECTVGMQKEIRKIIKTL